MNEKRHPNHYWRMTAALLTTVYLLGVVIGCVVIWAVPFYSKKEYLLRIASEKGNQVLSVGVMDNVLTYGMEHILYDEEGRVVSIQSQFLHQSQREYISSLVPQILEEGDFFIPAFLQVNVNNKNDSPKRVFGIISGTVVEGKTGNRFVSVLLRELTDLDTIMITYVILFTIMYLIGVTFLLVTVRKERELNRMRRDLIANVSHELKTPITSIRAMAETLNDGLLKDSRDQHIYCGKIIEESEHLSQLVMDILELSKLQSKRTEFKKIQTHADGIIPPVIDQYMMLCGDLGIQLDTSGLDLANVPLLYTDGEKLVTLMNILMDNAVKFTGKGAVSGSAIRFAPSPLPFVSVTMAPGFVKRI